MATELGKTLRKIRIDRDELLKDMAEKLDMSSSMLSSIENGTRKPPTGFFMRMMNAYDLTDFEKDELTKALSEEWGEVRIPISDREDDDKKLVLSFARSFEDLSVADKNRISAILHDAVEQG